VKRVLVLTLATALVAASGSAVGTLPFTADLRAQGWSIDLSGGRTVYGPLATTVGTNSFIGQVRYDSPRDTWVYGAAATPSGETGTFWTAAGAGWRLMRATHGGRLGVGADVGAHGFWFRDRLVSLTGTGGTLEAQPFMRLDFDEAFVEGSAGLRGHTLSFADVRENRGVFETGVRAGVGYGAAVLIEGAARWVRAAEGTFPLVSTTVAYERPRGGLWAQAGRWLDAELTDHIWGFGGLISVGPGTSIWAAVRREGPDPLYWNLPRRTWTVGVTQRLGRVPTPVQPLPRLQDGVVVIRLDVADAPRGTVSIAGDFNNWQPAPMVREGNEWVARLSLQPGVYHYAFRSAGGDWFVPASTAGRRDDGMGGHQAVLVVG
jgi:hypothetical protein